MMHPNDELSLLNLFFTGFLMDIRFMGSGVLVKPTLSLSLGYNLKYNNSTRSRDCVMTSSKITVNVYLGHY